MELQKTLSSNKDIKGKDDASGGREEFWETWRLGAKGRVLVLVGSNGRREALPFEKISDAVAHWRRREHKRVVHVPNAKEEDVLQYLRDGPWDVVHVIAHVPDGQETPHFPFAAADKDTVTNCMPLQRWKELVGEAQARVVVLTCCNSGAMAEALAENVGACIYTTGHVDMAHVPRYVHALYGDLLKGEKLSICFESSRDKYVRGTEEQPGVLRQQQSKNDGALSEEQKARMQLRPGKPTNFYRTDEICNVRGNFVIDANFHAWQREEMKREYPQKCERPVNLFCDRKLSELHHVSVSQVLDIVVQKSPGDVEVVGWQGFGKTALCKLLLDQAVQKSIQRKGRQVLLFYVPCRNFRDISLSLDALYPHLEAQYLRVLRRGFEKHKFDVLWLLDDDEDGRFFTDMIRNTDMVLRLKDGAHCAGDEDFFLGPKPAAKQLQSISDLIDRMPSDIGIEPGLLKTLKNGAGRVNLGVLEDFVKASHPIWSEWSYGRGKSLAWSMRGAEIALTLESTSWKQQHKALEDSVQEKQEHERVSLQKQEDRSKKSLSWNCISIILGWFAFGFSVIILLFGPLGYGNIATKCPALSGASVNVTVLDQAVISGTNIQGLRCYRGVLSLLIKTVGSTLIGIAAFPGGSVCSTFDAANSSLRVFPVGYAAIIPTEVSGGVVGAVKFSDVVQDNLLLSSVSSILDSDGYYLSRLKMRVDDCQTALTMVIIFYVFIGLFVLFLLLTVLACYRSHKFQRPVAATQLETTTAEEGPPVDVELQDL